MKDLVARILSPHISVRVGGKTYKVKQNVPWELKSDAQGIYDDIVYANRFEKFLRRKEVEPILEGMGFAISSMSQLHDRVKTLKKDLYRKYPDLFSQRPIRNELRSIRNELNKLNSEIGMLDFYTLEAYAERKASLFIMAHSVEEEVSDALLETIYWKVAKTYCSVETIRGLARNDWWRTYWSTKKTAVFKYQPLTDEQIALASYSRMYDNVYKHMESPPQAVIDDDDMLDGWLLLQNEPKKKQPTYGHKIDSSKEVFIMAQNEDHAKSIYEMNTPEQQAVQRSRLKQLGAKGQLQFGQFADVQRGVQNAAR